MIDELPPNVRALVSAGRGPLSPDAATVARMRANIHVAVGIGAVAGTGAAAATGTSAVIGKIAAIALAVTAATVGGVAYVRHVQSDPAVAPTLSVSTTTTTAPADDLEIMPTVIAVEREPMPAPDFISDAPAAVSPAIVPPPAPAPAPAPVPSATLAREIELVDQATQALRRGDHAGVIAAVRTYETETSGHGQLAEDAAAIALEAACTSKDPDAATKLAAFTKRWPQSAQRARLTAVCHEGATP